MAITEKPTRDREQRRRDEREYAQQAVERLRSFEDWQSLAAYPPSFPVVTA